MVTFLDALLYIVLRDEVVKAFTKSWQTANLSNPVVVFVNAVV